MKYKKFHRNQQKVRSIDAPNAKNRQIRVKLRLIKQLCKYLTYYWREKNKFNKDQVNINSTY